MAGTPTSRSTRSSKPGSGPATCGCDSRWAAPGTATVARHELTDLKAFNQTLMRIKESYVDPSRIDPKRMLYQALNSVQLNIPEVLVESDPGSDKLTVVVNDTDT